MERLHLAVHDDDLLKLFEGLSHQRSHNDRFGTLIARIPVVPEA